jgi:hypothetical protein
MNSTPGSTAAPPRSGRTVKGLLVKLTLLAVVLVVLYTLFILWWSYSEGERAGLLQKFSKRGWVCKTYEGELALYVVGGVAPQIWHFSVRDDALAVELHKNVGRQMRIHYTEHPGLPTTCFGETDYFADRFEPIGTPQSLPSASGLAVQGSGGAPPQPASSKP